MFLFSFLYYLVQYDVAVYQLGIIIKNIRTLDSLWYGMKYI